MGIVNLCFVDDLFLFAYGDANSARILLFKEGWLPVKYLGVPLISSRLVYRDCKELIERIQKRIQDWKNKSLSAARRLQLVQSVLGSIHVCWASVFILPSRILLDIEQLMRGFLWCQGKMMKGKGKVAWDIPCRGNMTWGWQKLLHLRPIIYDFIWHRIESGSTVFAWFDKWCSNSPFSNVISMRDIHRAGFNVVTKVRDISIEGSWHFPSEWSSKYPNLNMHAVLLFTDLEDVLEWRDLK
ncbi:hypothetical protein Tco_0131925, partial [Tanacetum coccineum]